MDLEKQLSKLEQDSFNGQISISDFRKRVQTYAETYHALQLQQAGVKQSVFYSIVDNGTVLEKFKEKETAEYALEEYKRMGFPYATILETVA